MNINTAFEKQKELKQKANRLPLNPGVYIMKDKSETVIYVGKAQKLKNRVSQYFVDTVSRSPKTRMMVRKIHHFDVIVAASEFEALVLEASLIKQNQPKYNILLKDDKGYFYIKITDEKWQKIETAKQTDKNGEYIGPYNSGFIVKETVDQVNKIFKLPTCNRSFDNKSKPCLNYHIGICFAPCKNSISIDEYKDTVNSAKEYIKKGELGEEAIDVLRQKMELAAENLQFEAAARLRDRINAISKINQKQSVVSVAYKNQDVIATATFENDACVEVLIFRNFRLADKKHYFINGTDNKKEIYLEFLQQYYMDNADIPNRILLDVDVSDFSIIQEWLSEKSGKKVNILCPKQGDSKGLVDMCLSNAAQNLSDRTKRDTKEMAVLNDLAKLLGLSNPPKYIEAYDISNTAGENNVAGMIVFKDGKPYKKAYKRFKIKSFVGQDDYRSMAEVLDRRFLEYEKGEDEAFSNLPDLILLDGAKGQISAVLPVLQKHNINVAIFGMVKDSKHRTRAIATTGADITIKSNRRVFTLITNIQDEVHRFAITYHREKHGKSSITSRLTAIDGIGKKKAELLIKHFRTVSALSKASKAELSDVKGISKSDAERVYRYFNSEYVNKDN